nr:MAG TPA: hypothetical protein [Bacteriophage sp.]
MPLESTQYTPPRASCNSNNEFIVCASGCSIRNFCTSSKLVNV